MNRVLFILKFREASGGSDGYSNGPYGDSCYSNGRSSGLLNSAQFVQEMLAANGVESKLVQVNDNNDIDREVAAYRPTHVILEALWVVPDKFKVLTKLHPDVTWIVRIHSELPFLSTEGIALEWLFDYLEYDKVLIACNSRHILKTLRAFVLSGRNEHGSIEECAEWVDGHVLYFPNYYPLGPKPDCIKCLHHPPDIHIGCFGAIRPMKNQLVQAAAAIAFAESEGRRLVFHMNSDCSKGGDSVLRNIKSLFQQGTNTLALHDWMSHEDFIELLRTMDAGMQVSFSETFNIVAADMVSVGLPIVVSEEVSWTNPSIQADVTSVPDIVSKMHKALGVWRCYILKHNWKRLGKFSAHSMNIWFDYFGE